MDVRASVSSRKITDGHIHGTESQNTRGKEEFKIAEGIKLAEVPAPGRHAFVVAPAEQLSAAERIAEAGIENPAQCLGKKHVSEPVEKPHGLSLHGIDQARAVDEIGVSLAVRFEDPSGRRKSRIRWIF